jgi:tetratricopeptide (TPR) repeat protein
MPSPTPKRPASESLATELRGRLRGLDPADVVMMRRVMRLHAAGDRRGFAIDLMQLRARAPDHPEVLFWLGVLHAENAAWPEAVETLSRAVAQRSDDLRLWSMLGAAQGNARDAAGARESFRRAAMCEGSAGDCLKLSIECDRQGLFEEALMAVDAALRQDRQSPVALLQRARCHKALGHAQAAAADCRALIASGRESARAWFALIDLKTVPLSDAERHKLEAATQRPGTAPADRLLLDFALGQALEDAGEHQRALAVFQRANAAVRAASPWQSAAFERHVQALRAAFDGVPIGQAAPQGREVIFLVGLPRSGSTLIEQVIAAHPQVEGASELPYLGQVIEAESRRRGQAFPAWVGEASNEDWTRLGQDYLRLSARWREGAPIATDKLPDNWQYVGAIRAMLPQARIIDCQRDPLETCWSCYKQLFGPGLASFSYDFDSLAQYARACDRLGNYWAQAFPDHVRRQSYEALVASPEAQIRELLSFCGLPFDAACLDFQNTSRAIRTPSALQVRQPLRQTSTRAARYGPLLDPLRRALGQTPSPIQAE